MNVGIMEVAFADADGNGAGVFCRAERFCVFILVDWSVMGVSPKQAESAICRRSANLVVRREARAPRRLRKQGNGAKSPSAFPCKTTRAYRPDGALPRRCRASLATALQGVSRAFVAGLFAHLWRKGDEWLPRTAGTAFAEGRGMSNL